MCRPEACTTICGAAILAAERKQASGLPYYGHGLPHGTHQGAKSDQLHAIQQQVGHASSLTTDIYAKLAPEEVREAYDRVG